MIGDARSVMQKQTLEAVYDWPLSIHAHTGPGFDTGAPPVVTIVSIRNGIMKIGLALALAFLAASPAAAQDTPDTVELRELVVSATRLPMERNTVATSVTVLRASELRARGVRTVAEALRTVSGATLVQSGFVRCIRIPVLPRRRKATTFRC